jgi:OFA family oxalate/formate antiporter-like MFS transporter
MNENQEKSVVATPKKNEGVKVLAVGTFMQLFLGIIYVWAVFVVPVSQHWKWEVPDVKLVSSYMLAFFVMGILAGGRVLNKFGAQKMVLIGGLIVAAGMLITSLLTFGTAVFVIYITYGIMSGFGVGVAYNAIISSAQKWFPHKRGLATGIAVSAFGFSTVIFAPLVEHLIERVELVTTFRILALVFAVVTLACFSFIKLPPEQEPSANASTASPQQTQYTTSQMLKTPAFYLIALSMMFLTASYFILNPSFKSIAAERGYEEIGTYLVMLTGITSSLGRLAVPVLGDKIGATKAVLCIMLATALCTLGLCLNGKAILIISIGVIAFCFGGSSAVFPVVTGRFFGLKNIGANYGCVMCGYMISSLSFPLIIGKIENETAKFLTLATVAALGVVTISVVIESERKRITK